MGVVGREQALAPERDQPVEARGPRLDGGEVVGRTRAVHGVHARQPAALHRHRVGARGRPAAPSSPARRSAEDVVGRGPHAVADPARRSRRTAPCGRRARRDRRGSCGARTPGPPARRGPGSSGRRTRSTVAGRARGRAGPTPGAADPDGGLATRRREPAGRPCRPGPGGAPSTTRGRRRRAAPPSIATVHPPPSAWRPRPVTVAPSRRSAPAATAASATASAMLPNPRRGYRKVPAPGPGAPGEPAHDGRRRRGADPPAGQLAGQVAGVGIPQLAGVGPVEGVEHRRVRGRPAPPRRTCRPAGAAAGRSRRRTPPGPRSRRGVRRSRSPVRSGKASQRSSRRMRPWRGRTCRSAPSRPRSGAQHLGRRGGVQPVAAVVDPQAGDVERPGHAPDGTGPFEHHDVVPRGRRPPRRGQPRRAGSEDGDHVRAAQPPAPSDAASRLVTPDLPMRRPR